jgi:hypothetical protein
MKRGVFDVIRRGLDNTVANWGVLVVRLIETVVIVAIVALTAIAVLVPTLVSIGITLSDIRSLDDIDSLSMLLLEKWALFLWIFVAALVVTIVVVALHSFVTAGAARVYVDGERIAGNTVLGPRSRFKVFSTERWFAGARDGWWTVFWIYNFAWGVGGLFLLIPLIPTLILTLVFYESPPVAITSGCIGLVVTMMLAIVVTIVTGMWTTRAVGDWAVHRTGAAASLATAWQSLKRDLGRHLLIAIAMMIIALAGSSFFASFSFFAALGQTMHETAVLQLMALPIRFVGTLLSSIFSAFVTSWTLASYASLAEEGRR